MNYILMPVRTGVQMTYNAIQSMLKQDIGDIQVIVIDNSVDSAMRHMLRPLYAKVVNIYKYPPIGVAESWNFGLRTLFKIPEVKHILVCNNDIILRPDTYRLLVETSKEFVTAVGNNDPECVNNMTLPINPPRNHPDFSCFLMRRNVWNIVGEFDERFKGAFCKDNDYHVRMHSFDIEAVCIDLPFYHIGSATINSVSDKEREELCKQADSNREYFKEKWGFSIGSPEYGEFFKF